MVRTVVLSALVVMAASCSSPSQPPLSSESPTTAEASAVAPESTVAGAPSVVPPELDLEAKPFIVFAPVGPQPQRMAGTGFPDGAADYFGLFTEDAMWKDALAHVGSFKIHSWQAREYFSDEELEALFAFLERNEIPLMVEMEPLNSPDPAECSHGESFEGPHEIATAKKIKSLGGTIAAAAIEQPYTYAHKLDTPGACQYSLERIMDEVLAFNDELRAIFPDIVIGSIEGVWVDPETSPEDMALWLDTYEEAAGEPFAFLHMDLDWTGPNWETILLGIEEVARDRGVPFGVIYNGNGEDTNDEWLLATAARMTSYEVDNGGSPDHVIFQSWVDQPDRVLPDNDPGAFSSLINRYFGTRPKLVNLAFDASDRTVGGRFETDEGAPIEGAMVEVTALPLSGIVQTVVIEGVAPEFASAALIGIRVNAEGAGFGALEAKISSIEFDQDGLPSPLRWDFIAGANGWGVSDTAGTAVFSDGEMSLSANLGEQILINGETFDVVPAVPFSLTVEMSVFSELDVTDSGLVLVMFLAGDAEIQRDRLDITGHRIELGSSVTDVSGNYSVVAGDLEPGTYLLEAHSDGTFNVWTADARGVVDIE